MAAIPQSHPRGSPGRVLNHGLVSPDLPSCGVGRLARVSVLRCSHCLGFLSPHSQHLDVLVASSSSLHRGGLTWGTCACPGKADPPSGSVTGLSVLALKTHTRNTMTSESGRNLGQGKWDFLQEPLHSSETEKTENENWRGKNLSGSTSHFRENTGLTVKTNRCLESYNRPRNANCQGTKKPSCSVASSS